PADNPDLKPRLPASILVHENSYQPLDKDALAQYDEQLAEYYLTRGSNNRRDTWSDHIRRTIIKESRCRFNLSMQHPFQLSLSVF
ncbi:hypothetical protein GVI27_11680, partial [Escherichia coli]|nr:hypothetical protein [Escherichia coli]